MLNHCTSKSRLFVAFLGLTLAIQVSLHSQTYEVTRITTPNAFAPIVRRGGLNEAGEVAIQGTEQMPFTASIWTRQGVRDLGQGWGALGATAVQLNNTGTTIGYLWDSHGAGQNGFCTWSFGIPTGTYTVQNGGMAAGGVNDSGLIVGRITVPWDGTNPGTGVVFHPGGGYVQLLGFQPNQVCYGFAINSAGQIAGMIPSGSIYIPVLWNNESAAPVALPLVSGSPWAIPTDINELGDITGYLSRPNDPNGNHQAFLWKSGTMAALPDLGYDSIANAMNNFGDCVGNVKYSAVSRGEAAVWLDKQLVRLNFVLKDAPGVLLDNAWDINDNGEIIAMGSENGAPRTVFLSPIYSSNIYFDSNRDGGVSTGDPTTTPYRFWLNDDDDSTGTERVPIASADNGDQTIGSTRDLEDFSKCLITFDGLVPRLRAGTMKLGFKWRNVTNGNPSVRIFEAAGQTAAFTHLSDINVANSQFGAIRYNTALNSTALNNGDTLWIPASFWDNIQDTDTSRYFLFEGVSAGTGEIVMVISKPSGDIIESGSAAIDLKPITELYQRNGTLYTPPAAELPEVLIFVHGWNQSPEESDNFAQTMFKRLWLSGYKGRFASIRWNTFWSNAPEGPIQGYLADFNESERIAWTTGVSLKSFVDSMPTNYSRSIAAHSMGNVVVGSALQAGLKLQGYAILNGAVPVSAYDTNSKLKRSPTAAIYGGVSVTLWATATPDGDTGTITKGLAYKGQLSGISSGVAGPIVSFYLTGDTATGYDWEFNNYWFRPDAYYKYDPKAKDGKRLYVTNQYGDVVSYLSDKYIAMPFADQSWGKTIGAESQTAGPITSKVDLNTFGFGSEHSAEWRRSVQQTWSFYVTLKQSLAL
jgi:hypothetical protein